MEKDIGLVEESDLQIEPTKQSSKLKRSSLGATTDYSIQASTSSDVKLSGKIYKDVWNKGRWVVKAEWEWRNSDWQSDRKGTGNVGKLDGLGLIVDEDI
ncbi:hypothetical protein EI200_12990 [Peribacillus simplex]|uniref:hypothetical protein n=1 Tax=Peribacillus simplex TaxID=1478 RepID=UPI000F644395|nr:hypothetical protein [Peribacillus simplex]RRN70934.1 hypothetical protein EI200_12990 [Peribacillus simplex]